jgi:hypothetical protein
MSNLVKRHASPLSTRTTQEMTRHERWKAGVEKAVGGALAAVAQEAKHLQNEIESLASSQPNEAREYADPVFSKYQDALALAADLRDELSRGFTDEWDLATAETMVETLQSIARIKGASEPYDQDGYIAALSHVEGAEAVYKHVQRAMEKQGGWFNFKRSWGFYY